MSPWAGGDPAGLPAVLTAWFGPDPHDVGGYAKGAVPVLRTAP
ncbi:hypothetical protein GCM10010151_67500 [Actinoallomurus spadix]|uniref:Uncharacterized protein n=1 Tax=Actinoallomurus spadix TaxID=79912 RepID=A0ABP3HDP5_9ACTN